MEILIDVTITAGVNDKVPPLSKKLFEAWLSNSPTKINIEGEELTCNVIFNKVSCGDKVFDRFLLTTPK